MSTRPAPLIILTHDRRGDKGATVLQLRRCVHVLPRRCFGALAPKHLSWPCLAIVSHALESNSTDFNRSAPTVQSLGWRSPLHRRPRSSRVRLPAIAAPHKPCRANSELRADCPTFQCALQRNPLASRLAPCALQISQIHRCIRCCLLTRSRLGRQSSLSIVKMLWGERRGACIHRRPALRRVGLT